MENYKFIVDEDKLKQFINEVVPPLEKFECLFLGVAARNKYVPDVRIRGNTDFIRKEIVVKENLIQKLRQMECAYGAYVDNTDNPIPQEAMVVYLTMNPRSHKSAAFSMLKALVDNIQSGAEFNLKNMAVRELHTTIGRKLYLDIDIDIKDRHLLTSVYTFIGNTKHLTIETRGGYHVLIKKDDLDPDIKKTFFNNLKTLGEKVEFKSDPMVPVPGTYQGGFVPRIL